MRAALLGACATLVLAGCAAHTPAVLHFGMLDAPEGRQVAFPPAPEVPRYLYAGELTGESNFQPNGTAAARSVMRRVFDAITGLDSADAPRSELQRPVAGMSSDAEGRIYVTDMSRQAVYVFDQRAGELQIWDRAYGMTPFAAPVGIAAGRDGEVLVVDADLALVARLDRQGNPRGTLGKGLLQRPTGIARDPQTGVLFVADTQAHDVKVFSEDGTFIRTLGRRGDAAGEFNYPTHLAFARGELYVTDTMNSRVQVFGAEGEAFKRQFGGPGLYVGNLVRPKGIALDSEGNAYVIEGYYDHLLVFSDRGELLLPIGGTGSSVGRFFLPNGVWVDARNRVFVADMFNGRVAVFQFLGGD
ncbi:MAG TPA: 6-bladed beta-propeller [Burkholderiales bacterium]